MRKKTINIFLGFTLFFVTGIYAQSTQKQISTDSLAQKYMSMARSSDAKEQAKLKKELYALLKSKDEQNWLLAMRIFGQLNMQGTEDSLLTVAKKKFPKGILARNAQVSKIYDEKDPVKKEELFKSWMKKFSPKRLGDDIVYDYARYSVGAAYAEAGNSQKAMEYANQMEDSIWKGQGWSAIAMALKESGDMVNAGILFQRCVTHAESFMGGDKQNDPGARFVLTGYASYCNEYAAILYEKQKYEEAFEYLNKSPRPLKDQTYINILMALGRNLEAFLCLNEMAVNGRADTKTLGLVKELYAKLNGSDAGYDQYLSAIQTKLAEELDKKLKESMVNEPAPQFTLKDAEGNNVSLSDYKGKIVILDFWATWCGPCKRSFPAMQMAVNKYKDNPDVKFLFIHTWEKEENATESAKQYLKENNYNFHLLMDLKDPKTRTNKVVSSYKVKGIPTKFIIDAKGNIRFKVTGAPGSNETIVEEISKMIEMAGKE